MFKIVAVLLWPVGVAVLCCLGILWARQGRVAVAGPGAAAAKSRAVPGGRAASPGGPSERRVMRKVLRFLLLVIAGTIMIYAVMVPLAWLVGHVGGSVDRHVFSWMAAHRLRPWTAMMQVATQVGDKYPTSAAAATAAVCLAVTWRSNRWLPPVALASLFALEHYLTIAIANTIHSVSPPGGHGTFPSGGSDRAVAIYGLIAYLLWREFSGRRRAGIWAAVAVAAVGFSEAYSHVYLGIHWFTDILGGLVYGCLLLGVFIAAVRAIAGPAIAPLQEVAPVSADIPSAEAGAVWTRG